MRGEMPTYNRKKIITGLPVLIAALLVAVMLSACTDDNLHEALSLEEINSIEVTSGNENEGYVSWLLNSTEEETFIDWFNSCTSIKSNKDFAGEATIETGIMIDTDTVAVSLINSGQDFEVQVRSKDTGEVISYWAKQPDINDFFTQIEEYENQEVQEELDPAE
jgi:hypothetical protein